MSPVNSPVDYQTHPDRYRRWRLQFEGKVSTLVMAIEEDASVREGYKLQLNSDDLGVDIELNDAVQRIRFEHPEVRTVIVISGQDRVFCSGASTGTGSAPMRAMTEPRRRQRAAGQPNAGKPMLFFGARRAEELPHHGPLTRLPADFIETCLAFSRAPAQPRTCVQDRLRERAADVAELLRGDTFVYLCGLKGLETGVLDALNEACSASGFE